MMFQLKESRNESGVENAHVIKMSVLFLHNFSYNELSYIFNADYHSFVAENS